MALHYGDNARIPQPAKSGALGKALLAVLVLMFIGAALAYLVVPFEPARLSVSGLS